MGGENMKTITLNRDQVEFTSKLYKKHLNELHSQMRKHDCKKSKCIPDELSMDNILNPICPTVQMLLEEVKRVLELGSPFFQARNKTDIELENLKN